MSQPKKSRYHYDYDLNDENFADGEMLEYAQRDLTELPPDMPVNPEVETLRNIEYTQAYLRTQIGKNVRVEFLIGTNILLDKAGILEEVGISYIILKEVGSNTRVLCDLYSIKFVNIYEI